MAICEGRTPYLSFSLPSLWIEGVMAGIKVAILAYGVALIEATLRLVD
jgi:hypothetical protein